MPRHQSLEHIDWPHIEPRPLSQAYDWATLLGWDVLPDMIAVSLADFIARMPVTQRMMEGYTPRAAAAEMKRISRELHREGRKGWHATEARQKVADPSTLPIVFHERLAPLAGHPTDALREAVEAFGQDIARLPDTNPQWEHTVLTAACSVGIYWMSANPISRSKAAAWEFALAMLDSAELPTQGLRRNPKRLKKRIGHLLAMMQPV